MALVAAEDIGRTAYGIFLAGPAYIGRTVGLAGRTTRARNWRRCSRRPWVKKSSTGR